MNLFSFPQENGNQGTTAENIRGQMKTAGGIPYTVIKPLPGMHIVIQSTVSYPVVSHPNDLLN